MDAVDITLREWRRTPFVYGLTDCMLSVGRYIASIGGIDLTAEFEGRYDDHTGAMRAMSEAGGFSTLMKRSGMIPVDRPERGDVVGLGTEDGDNIGALCTDGMIAARLERGVWEVRIGLVRFVGAWRVGR